MSNEKLKEKNDEDFQYKKEKKIVEIGLISGVILSILFYFWSSLTEQYHYECMYYTPQIGRCIYYVRYYTFEDYMLIISIVIFVIFFIVYLIKYRHN